MRQCTKDKGFFTVTDVQHTACIPRSTAQDWINRLLFEGCVFQREEKRGRTPARYAAISALPSSTCKRIFTTVDGNQVGIFHDCMSGACAAFCGFHHTLAGGVITRAERDGTLLREYALIGMKKTPVGLAPLSAVGVCGVEIVGDTIIQHIQCIGGPAYSLTDMMARAEGVIRVEPHLEGRVVKGKIVTRALSHVTIGIDDTDSKDGGATFALAFALLNHISRIEGALPISHHVVMLNPDVVEKTAGNSASYIELAAPPGSINSILETVQRFIADETFSPNWGIAVRTGLCVPRGLRVYGNDTRNRILIREDAQMIAQRYGVQLEGGNGIIGALGAVALAGLPHEVLLDPLAEIPSNL